MEDAGYRAADLAQGQTGVFLATGKSDYEELLYRNDVTPDAELATGVASAIIANRISFALGLTGPSLAIDAACSGSLAALHMAAQSILAGDCTSALVSAVNLILTPTLSRSLKAEGALSPDCRTRSFDAAGNGYARGEGVVTLLLKKQSGAVADGDHIYGLLVGSAISHGGRANWLTAPNPTAQKRLITTAWQRAGVDPRTVTYIEAHGTGTPLGDPIEFNAIRQAYEELAGRGDSVTHRCSIGSAKANIGHLEAASGLAGVVKVLLAMRHACLPGNPQLRTVNPMCKTQGTPFHFVQRTEPWPRLKQRDGTPMPFRAGVSAFGFGGAYGHVVIEENSPSRSRGTENENIAPVLPILPISARDAEALGRQAQQLLRYARHMLDKDQADEQSGLEDFLYTFQVGRTPLPWRAAILVRDWQGLVASLANFVAGTEDPDVIARPATTGPAIRDEMADLSFRFAREWVSVAKVDFAGLYGTAQRRRVSAPGYPFART
ncbi:beta-ketoacyl synthase N-terminal-like domain-containing protein, partial [Rhizobiaceae sp. 2RAB30]